MNSKSLTKLLFVFLFFLCLALFGVFWLDSAFMPPELKLIQDLIAQQKYPEAILSHEAYLKKFPEHFESRYNLGGLYYLTQKYAEAEQAYVPVLNTPNLKLRQFTLYNLGNVAFCQNKIKEAQAFYEGALAIDPQYEKARLNIEFIRQLKNPVKCQMGSGLDKGQQNQEKSKQDQKNDQDQDSKNPPKSQQNQSGKGDQPQDQKSDSNPSQGDEKGSGLDMGQQNQEQKGEDQQPEQGQGDQNKEEGQNQPKKADQKEEQGQPERGDQKEKDEQSQSGQNESNEKQEPGKQQQGQAGQQKQTDPAEQGLEQGQTPDQIQNNQSAGNQPGGVFKGSQDNNAEPWLYSLDDDPSKALKYMINKKPVDKTRRFDKNW